MKQALRILCCALALWAVAPQAHAMDEEQVARCVLREVLAALTCKTPADFRYVGRRDEVYVFNSHYGAVFTEFYCQVFDKDVIVTCKAWQGHMGSARLNFDVAPGCITAVVNSPWNDCRARSTVQCCGTD